MAHANAIFLSFVSGAALVLAVAPGCNNNTTQPPETAINWSVSPGTNSPTICGAGGGVTWQIGNPESNPLDVVSNGTSFTGIPVTVECSVTPNSTGFSVIAQISYGNEGSLTVNGQFDSHSGAASTWPAETGISGTFSSGSANAFIETMSETDCSVTFTKNDQMGVADGRIWGVIDCPQAANMDSTCDGHAEFLFEYCGQ